MSTPFISEVLAENYLGLGATGIGVIGAIVEDLAHGRINSEWIDHWGTTRDEIVEALTDMIVDITPYLHAVRTPDGWVQL